MDNEKELLEERIKRWKRKLTLAQTMLRKYEAKLQRYHKRQQRLAAEMTLAAGRKFRL